MSTTRGQGGSGPDQDSGPVASGMSAKRADRPPAAVTVRENRPAPPIAPWRIRVFAAGTAVLLAVAVGYGVHAAHRHAVVNSSSPAPHATLSLTGTPKILYLTTAFGP